LIRPQPPPNQVIKASPAGYWHNVKSRASRLLVVGLPLLVAALFLALSGLFFGHSHPDSSLMTIGAVLAASVVVLIAAVAYVQTYVLTARITLKSGRLVRTAWLTRHSAIDVNRIGSVRRRSITYLGMSQPAYFVEDKRGRPILCVLASRWDPPALEAMWNTLGLGPTGTWTDSQDYDRVADLPRW
jgi:hypothetical protein